LSASRQLIGDHYLHFYDNHGQERAYLIVSDTATGFEMYQRGTTDPAQPAVIHKGGLGFSVNDKGTSIGSGTMALTEKNISANETPRPSSFNVTFISDDSYDKPSLPSSAPFAIAETAGTASISFGDSHDNERFAIATNKSGTPILTVIGNGKVHQYLFGLDGKIKPVSKLATSGRSGAKPKRGSLPK